MSRRKWSLADRLQAELSEPAPRGRHDWVPSLVPRDPAGAKRCNRYACNTAWLLGQQEPLGCTGEDAP